MYIPVQVFGKVEYVNTEQVVKICPYMYNGKEYAKIVVVGNSMPVLTSELVSTVMERLNNPQKFEYLTEEIAEANANNDDFNQDPRN